MRYPTIKIVVCLLIPAIAVFLFFPVSKVCAESVFHDDPVGDNAVVGDVSSETKVISDITAIGMEHKGNKTELWLETAGDIREDITMSVNFKLYENGSDRETYLISFSENNGRSVSSLVRKNDSKTVSLTHSVTGKRLAIDIEWKTMDCREAEDLSATVVVSEGTNITSTDYCNLKGVEEIPEKEEESPGFGYCIIILSLAGLMIFRKTVYR